MEGPIKEYVNIILGQNQEWSAAPEFYSGNELPVVSQHHFYVGIFSTIDGNCSGIAMSGARQISVYCGPIFCFRQLSVDASNPFNMGMTFAGYRVYAPNYLLPIKRIVKTIIRSFSDPGTYSYFITFDNGTTAGATTLQERGPENDYGVIGSTDQNLIDAGFTLY